MKKSLRIVNKNPQLYAPVLFDLLRFVLQECGIRTSPEALLEEVFNASKLKSQLQDIHDAIVDSSVFQNMPQAAQQAVKRCPKSAAITAPPFGSGIKTRTRSRRDPARHRQLHVKPHHQTRPPVGSIQQTRDRDEPAWQRAARRGHRRARPKPRWHLLADQWRPTAQVESLPGRLPTAVTSVASEPASQCSVTLGPGTPLGPGAAWRVAQPLAQCTNSFDGIGLPM
ncbi:MAG: hypothetical protein H7Z15_02120 [Rhizobacter sp.]|nr:hypothetical protein [Rhizobacter sp.]